MSKSTNKSRSVLISPLDWGLGHTTRCIPIIQFFLYKNWKVVIACAENSASHILLRKEFPALEYVFLKGYGIQYSQDRKTFAWKMFLQIPKILQAIGNEHFWLKQYTRKNHFDLIISDNRYGFFHRKIPSIFMTHQLNMLMPYKWLATLVRKINYSYINKYTRCWVPDIESGDNVAGILSHPSILPKIPLQYIGPLSRLGRKIETEKVYKFLCIMSGPEPQRTILENKILEIAPQLSGKMLIVRGLPHSSEIIKTPSENCTIVSHLDNEAMKIAFASSEYIVSRSGYTTVMELIDWQKKSILIPTPGQTEQEYLGKYLMEKNRAFSFEQIENDFVAQFAAAMQFEYSFLDLDFDIYKKEIEKTLLQLHLND